MAYRAMPQASTSPGPRAIVDRFVGLHRVLFASSLGALDPETERLGAVVRAASATFDAERVEPAAAEFRHFARQEFRTELTTHFDTLAMLGAWILRDGRPLDELAGRWRDTERKLRACFDDKTDPPLVATFVLAGIRGEFGLDDADLQRCRALVERLGHDDPSRRTPWLLPCCALLTVRPESPDAIADWIDEARRRFEERTRGVGNFSDEAVLLACLSGLGPSEVVDRMIALRSTPLLPLEPLEAGALCQLSLDTDTLNATLRAMVQQLWPYAARGRHEAIRWAVAATLMGMESPVCRVTADVVSYVRVTARRIHRARRGGFIQ